MKHTYRLAAVIGAAAIAVGVALGGGAANAAPSPTPKPTVKPTKKPTPKPTVRKPFRVAWTNQNQGAIPYPGLTDGFQAAVQYVNNNGGINGRKLEIVNPCYTDMTPQLAQSCGNQIANNAASVNMVMVGINLVPGALYDALKPTGMPTLISVPASQPDWVAPNAVTYNGGGTIVGASVAAIAKKEGAKTVSMISSNTAAGIAAVDDAGVELLKQGIVLNKVYTPVPYTDALPLLLQSKAATVDLIANQLSGLCLPFVKAQQQLGIASSKTATSSNCASGPLISQAPSAYEGAKVWLFSDDFLEGKGVSSDLDTFIDNYPKYAGMYSQASGVPTFANSGWASVIGLRDALKGKPDSVLDNKASLLAALRAFKGPAPLGPDVLNCGGYPQFGPAICTNLGAFAEVKNGKYVKYRP